MKLRHSSGWTLLLAAVVTAGLLMQQSMRAADAADLAPLPLKPPMPTLKGTPDDLPKGPHIEPPPTKPRPPFMAPKGVVNVALNKKVTASDKNPFTGTIDQVTDGQKEAFDDQVLEMRKGTQYVQIDLETAQRIYALVFWNDHRYIHVYHDVIIQLADDPDFTKNVKTLYNNDIDNSSGLGIGTDREYFETENGRLIDAKGATGRYLRWYTRGNNLSAFNCRTEMEVYALPAK